MSAGDWIGLALGCAAVGAVARRFANVSGLPSVVFLLAGGLLLRAAGFQPVPIAHGPMRTILAVALAVVLFHGGVAVVLADLRRAGGTVALLVGPGLVVTATVTGVAAAAAFHISLLAGLLVGVVLAPTDPAILIPLFRKFRLPKKLQQTIVAEAALNDPVAAILAAVLAAVLVQQRESVAAQVWHTVQTVLVEIGLGACVGAAAVVALRVVGSRLGARAAGVAVFGALLLSLAELARLLPSVYLTMFVAGVVVSAASETVDYGGQLLPLVEQATDVAVVAIFVVVGINLPNRATAHLAVGAMAVVAVLMLVARPLAVLVSVLPNRRAQWRREELIFLCWTRETGVMAIGLSAYVAALGVPGGTAALAAAGCATVVTLVLQASLKARLAVRLGFGGDGAVEPVPDALSAVEVAE